MANAIVLVKDDRVRRSIELYLEELDMDVRFATFKTPQEFQSLYFRVMPPEPEGKNNEKDPPSEDGAELKLFSEIHLMIFAMDTIVGRSGQWIDQTLSKLRKFKHLPESGQPTRLVMLKYEDDNVPLVDILHPQLDDLIYLPLDRLLFLQKMQILLSLPKRVSPTFLFNQEIRAPIEISKIAKLDRLSDVGLAIRNPVPLKKGLPGHFYVTFPGEKTQLEIKAKVLRSDAHPEYPDQYLVYFTFFGLNRSALSAIRRALSKSPQYKSFAYDDRDRFRFRPDDLFMEDSERRSFGIIVIDSDESAGNSLAQTLSNEMDRLNVTFESSYQVFMHRYLESGGGDQESTPPHPTSETDFFAERISLTVAVKDLKCLSVDPGPSETAQFLGHPAQALFGSPDRWLSLIQDKTSRLVLEEAAGLADQGRVLEKLVTMLDVRNQRCAVKLKLYRGAGEHMATVEISPASLADIMDKSTSRAINSALDALVIDAGFVPKTPASWVEGLRLRAAQVGLTSDPSQLKIWIVSDTDRVPTDWLNCPDLLGMLVKPADQRQLIFSLAENLPNRNTMYQFENLGWTSPSQPIHVAKEVEIESLSEFGATLKSRQRIVPGSMVYLRKMIYDNAPNGCLAARVYACEDHPNEKGIFSIFASYFGISDHFLKFARSWIRENYAHQKAKSD